MELYFIRHGESEANAAGVYSGWAPYPLTKRGEEQAVETGRLIEGVRFDRVIVSDILRARQTASLIFPDHSVELNEAVRELDVTPVAGQPIAEVKARLRAISENTLKDYDYSVLGCESNTHFTRRVADFLDSLDKSSPERVAVVTHFGVLRAVMACVCGIPLERVSVRADNCGVSVLESAGGRWVIRHWNYTRTL